MSSQRSKGLCASTEYSWLLPSALFFKGELSCQFLSLPSIGWMALGMQATDSSPVLQSAALRTHFATLLVQQARLHAWGGWGGQKVAPLDIWQECQVRRLSRTCAGCCSGNGGSASHPWIRDRNSDYRRHLVLVPISLRSSFHMGLDWRRTSGAYDRNVFCTNLCSFLCLVNIHLGGLQKALQKSAC